LASTAYFVKAIVPESLAPLVLPIPTRGIAMRHRFGSMDGMQGKCPELNAIENLWQFVRENWLSNRIFQSYANVVDHCCHAWNKVIDQPWRIMSIGLRDWAHRF
jgi:hypothetical protein